MSLKVLFATHDWDDYLASCLYDGLKEVLGAENVYDAGNNGAFHRLFDGYTPNHYICGCNLGPRLADAPDTKFDLLVINACFRAQYRDWHWPWTLRQSLKVGGKVAYVEGGDQARDINDPATASCPPFPVDAIFRREIDPTVGYPYQCYHLDFAAPARWVEETRKEPHAPRPIDVFYAGGPSHPLRYDMMRYLFHGQRQFSFVLSRQENLYPFTPPQYFSLLRRSKIALCPPGGAHCSSTMRVWEALACGALPIYLCHQRRYQSPGLPGRRCDTLEELPRVLDQLLGWPDLDSYRERLLDEVACDHTTEARARKLLEAVGLQ
jgi:hypothetical protein